MMARLRDRFPDVPMIGLDLPDPELASHWRSADISCLFGDGTALPFADDAFDLVLAIEVLEHVPGPDAALRELSRVCSGTLIASVPLEPIWRAGNLAAAPLRAPARQHPGPRQPLVAAWVQPLRRRSVRHRTGEEPAALDDGARPSHRLTSLTTTTRRSPNRSGLPRLSAAARFSSPERSATARAPVIRASRGWCASPLRSPRTTSPPWRRARVRRRRRPATAAAARSDVAAS